MTTPWWQPLLPQKASVSPRERLRASVGALIGLFVTGCVSAWLVDSPVTALWLMAPMGASAVLLFGVPASPLAQPWPVVAGNLLAAVIGVACVQAILNVAPVILVVPEKVVVNNVDLAV